MLVLRVDPRVFDRLKLLQGGGLDEVFIVIFQGLGVLDFIKGSTLSYKTIQYRIRILSFPITLNS